MRLIDIVAPGVTVWQSSDGLRFDVHGSTVWHWPTLTGSPVLTGTTRPATVNASGLSASEVPGAIDAVCALIAEPASTAIQAEIIRGSIFAQKV